MPPPPPAGAAAPVPAAAGEVVEEERQQERAEPATPEALQPPIISAAAGEEEATADEEAAGDPAAAAARDPPGGAEGAVEAATDTGGEGAASEDGEDAEVAGLAARLHSVLAVEEETGVALKRPPLLSSFDLEGVADLIRSGRAKRIVLMCGAGISVSAGIPDFRTPGTGLYSRLEAYKLPHPTAVFEMQFFKRNPRPFYMLARELYPGTYAPTPTHYFMRLLHDKGLLLRVFTQNIDSLECQAGLPHDAVVPAHGNFDTARCIACNKAHDPEHVRAAVFSGEGKPAYCTHSGCRGLVKPGIVFFGENLPERFWERMDDFKDADLLIVMGTSLVVQPFASLIEHVGPEVPRLLINREPAGETAPELVAMGVSKGFAFSGPRQYRDALHLGDCDEGVRRLCQLLGWEEELEELVSAGGAAAAAQGGIVRGEAAAAEGADRAAAVVAAAAEAG